MQVNTVIKRSRELGGFQIRRITNLPDFAGNCDKLGIEFRRQ